MKFLRIEQRRDKTSADTMAALTHSHDGVHSHSHDGVAADHGHSHEILDGPGTYLGREMPIVEGRNWEERSFTIGIGG
jgi:urease accessory protein